MPIVKILERIDSVIIAQNYCTHSDDFPGSSLGSKHGENSCPTADVKHNFPLEQVFIVIHGISVG